MLRQWKCFQDGQPKTVSATQSAVRPGWSAVTGDLRGLDSRSTAQTPLDDQDHLRPLSRLAPDPVHCSSLSAISLCLSLLSLSLRSTSLATVTPHSNRILGLLAETFKIKSPFPNSLKRGCIFCTVVIMLLSCACRIQWKCTMIILRWTSIFTWWF